MFQLRIKLKIGRAQLLLLLIAAIVVRLRRSQHYGLARGYLIRLEQLVTLLHAVLILDHPV